VRVGRAAIDEEAIRLIEEHNPDVHFDWTRILKFPSQPEVSRATPVPAPRPEQPASARAHASAHAPVQAPEGPPAPAEAAQALEEPSTHAPAPADPISESAVLAAFEAEDEPPPAEAPRPSIAEARLGSEGLLRLRARYAEIMARISERQLDDSAREELKALAERLNPDAWVTEDEVRAGLDSYESVLATLRPLVGTPRRKRRRRTRS
jgi:hypothetical protein